MKYFNKKMAAREGFTLVELIVVIAILAILAGIAYPAYTGYIARAKEAAAVEQLSTINTAAQGLAAGVGKEVTKIVVEADAGAITNITVTYTTPDGNTAQDPTGKELSLLVTGKDDENYSSIKLGTGTYANGANWSKDANGTGTWKPGTT